MQLATQSIGKAESAIVIVNSIDANNNEDLEQSPEMNRSKSMNSDGEIKRKRCVKAKKRYRVYSKNPRLQRESDKDREGNVQCN